MDLFPDEHQQSLFSGETVAIQPLRALVVVGNHDEIESGLHRRGRDLIMRPVAVGEGTVDVQVAAEFEHAQCPR